MRSESHIPLTPRLEEAVRELKRLITAHFPQAAFVIEEGCDPEGIYLVTTLDIDDTDEVIAVVGDRLVELQVDEGLPVYVTPLRPIERVIAQLREREAATPLSPLPPTYEHRGLGCQDVELFGRSLALFAPAFRLAFPQHRHEFNAGQGPLGGIE